MDKQEDEQNGLSLDMAPIACYYLSNYLDNSRQANREESNMTTSRGKQSRTRDAQQAQEIILEAAEAVFAEHGFDGARIDAIAKASGYNVSLLFQYFGDKLNLYTEVLRRAYKEANALRARVFAPLLEHASTSLNANQFRAFLEAAIGGLFDYLVDHPQLRHMLLWEMAEGWQTYAKISTHLPTDKAEQFEDMFRQARQLGVLRSDFSPLVQLMQALQTCLSYLASLPLYQTMLPDKAGSSASGLTEARAYFIASVVAGIVLDAPAASSQSCESY